MNRNDHIELYYCKDEIGDKLKQRLDNKGVTYIQNNCTIGDSFITVNGQLLSGISLQLFFDSI